MKTLLSIAGLKSRVAGLCAFVLLWPGVVHGQDEKVRIVAIQPSDGLVEVSPRNAVTWVPTLTNATLHPFDRFRTGPNTRATLLWPDQSVVTVRPGTEIEIQPPHQPQAISGLRLLKGLFSFFHREKPGRIRIITRGAAAGIDGTEFVIEVDDEQRTILSVFDGRVEFTNELGGLILTNGQQAEAVAGRAPTRTAGFIANNVLQWAFYYPAVLDLRELSLEAGARQALGDSLRAYDQGDLLGALTAYPAGREPETDAERLYLAALVLSVGKVAQAEGLLDGLTAQTAERVQRLARALRVLIAAVKRQPAPPGMKHELTSELLAASYFEQSRATGDEALLSALELARQAVTNSPAFGFGWARVAELEFSFGRVERAREAVEKSLALTPRHAEALALKGFLLAAQNNSGEALAWFDRAIAVDSWLGNAWLGRGLARIRRGDVAGGREDLLIAAALEPQRAALRSYLGKALAQANDRGRALHELDIAQRLDPNDPTAWLYSALVKAEESRINEAIRDLEKSQELNDNRRLYRSRLLLDQDQAVRGANLALLYDDAGLADVALREASEAIAADYGNFAAHLFLATSYFVAPDYENARGGRLDSVVASEFLLAKLLGPPDGRILAQSEAHARHTPLFERDGLGFSSTTEYRSSGLWYQSAAQYGTYRNTGYSLEGNFLWDPGETPNREEEFRFFAASVKQQLTPRDGLLLEIRDTWDEYGDVGQRYDPANASRGIWSLQRQEPLVIAALDHRWNEAHHTLFLAAHARTSLDYTNARGGVYLLTTASGEKDGFFLSDLTQQYEIESTHNVLELQHLFSGVRTRTVGGFRFQHSTEDAENRQVINNGNAPDLEIYFGNPGTVIVDQSAGADAMRLSPYFYEYWQVVEPLWLIAGVSYDYQQIPENTRFGPVSDDESVREQVSPKAGLVWKPGPRSTVRAAYAQSLGGVDIEQNVRLEPTQVAGFVQAYRTLFPNALTGPAAGARSEIYSVSFEHNWPRNTYAAMGGGLLRSRADREVGAFRRELFTSSGPAVQLEERLRFEEWSAHTSLHQLLGDYVSAGVQYRIAGANLRRSHPTVPDAINVADGPKARGVLHLVGIDGRFRHPSGFFAAATANWWSQDLSGLGGLPSEAFWQFHLFAGYRFPRRRAEITVGILNVTDEDYRLYPINVYPDLPRERTFFTRLEINF